MTVVEIDQDDLEAAIDAAKTVQSHLRACRRHAPGALETENIRLRERIDIMERESVAGEIDKLYPAPNAGSIAARTAEAAREFATKALGEDRVKNVSDELVVEWVRSVLAQMAFRQTLIVILYFGLDGRGPRSLAHVARALDRSRANVAQNRDKALRMTRHPSRLRYFRELTNGVKG